MHRTQPIRPILCLLALVSLASCGGAGDPSAERLKRAASGRGEIVIGAAWPWEAHKDVLYWQGIELAEAEINGKGGINGRRIRILRADDGEDVEKGRLIAQEFGKNPDVVAVIGHLQSYVTVPAAAIYDLSGLLLVSSTATTSELTARGYRRVFRTIFSDVDVGKQMADYAVQRGYQRVVVYYARDEYGRGLANAFEERAAAQKVRVLDRQSYDPSLSHNLSDVQQTVEGWKDLNPDAVFIAGQSEQAAVLVTELRRRGMNAAILGSDALATPTYVRTAGAAAEGTVIASPFHTDAPSPPVRRFTSAFRARYQKDPDAGAALGYDAVNVLANAMRTAGTSSPDMVAEALHGTRGWEGVTGKFTFDQSGSLVDMPIRKVVVRNGAFHHLDETAAPR